MTGIKKILAISVLAVVILFVLPFILVRGSATLSDMGEATVQRDSSAFDNSAKPDEFATVKPEPTGSADSSVTVTLKNGDELMEMRLDDYLHGVVAAEMPGLFPEEALKAQAVAARTFTYNRLKSGSIWEEHGGAQVCTDPAHCKAYTDINDYREQHGALAGKIIGAVSATDGMVAVYGGEPILAVFHSTSGGMTESAADVWGGEVEYLLPVESPGEESAPRYSDVKYVTSGDFLEIIAGFAPEARAEGKPAEWIGEIIRSQSGGVKELELCGVRLTGGEMRSLFGLNSTWFELAYREATDDFAIETTGYGHRVGLSQYGAKAMALEDCGFEEIIKHYYTGVEIVCYS